MKKTSLIVFVIFIVLFAGLYSYNLNLIDSNSSTDENDWEVLFNGKNLDGWEMKIRGKELGDNFKNTFKVKDGLLKVSYEN